MSNGWNEVRLSEIARPIQRAVIVEAGTLYRTLGVKWWGEGAYERQTIDGSQTAAKTLSIVRESDLIINKIWVRHGSTAIVTKEVDGCAASGEFPTFELDRSRIEPRWMHWLSKTSSFWSKCAELSQGTSGKNRIKPENYLTIRIPLPSVVEQRRIVARIDELATKIEEARGLRCRATEESERILAATVSYLFSKGEKDGWLTSKVGDYVVDDCYGTSEKTNDDKSGTPVLRMGNIQEGRLRLNNFKYLHLSEKDRGKLLLKKGDILVNRTNSAELVGKCAVFEAEGEYAFASYIIRFRLDSERAEPKLIAWYINSSLGRSYIEQETRQMTGQANVSSSRLKEIPLSLPGLPEQRHIVAYLDDLHSKVDALRQRQTETNIELKALLPSILDKAFKGEL